MGTSNFLWGLRIFERKFAQKFFIAERLWVLQQAAIEQREENLLNTFPAILNSNKIRFTNGQCKMQTSDCSPVQNAAD